MATLYSDPVELGTVAADADGAVAATFTVPAETPAGTHTLELVGAESAVSVSATVTVTAAATTGGSADPDDATGPLPQTGADAPMIGLAVALLAAGLALIVSTGRRRPAMEPLAHE